MDAHNELFGHERIAEPRAPAQSHLQWSCANICLRTLEEYHGATPQPMILAAGGASALRGWRLEMGTGGT